MTASRYEIELEETPHIGEPKPPMLCTRPFQVSGGGSQISMPMPGDVEGASAGPGLPGPTMSLTR